MGEENNKNQKGLSSSLFKHGIKSAWKKLPMIVKLKIIGVVAAITLLFLLIIIVASIPQMFLDFSLEFDDNKEYNEIYEQYWGEFCNENNCSELQIEKAQEMKKSQESFYKKFNKLSEKYDLSDEQKYIILSTVFYGLTIEEFTSENGAFQLDSSENIDINKPNVGDVYEKESDTLKELIKQFKVYVIKCKYNDSNNEEKYEIFKDKNDKEIVYNWYNFTSVLDGEVKEWCITDKGGSLEFGETVNSEASMDNYYNYLKTSTYFDEKSYLKNYFVEYAKNKDLDINKLDNWSEEDKENVRMQIIYNIKDNVDIYINKIENSELITFGSSTEYWWPIGSSNIIFIGGKAYAPGVPTSTNITSYFGPREGSNNVSDDHKGIDIGATQGSNIIAATDGVITETFNDCATENSNGCGNHSGNHVVMRDSTGKTIIYAHMAKNTIKVKVNETVKQGQLLGRVGSSGDSTGFHLHFEIRLDASNRQSAINPLGYVSVTDTRPIETNSNSIAKYFYSSLINDGYSPQAAAAVLGNVQQESSFQPNVKDNRGAYGLCQWQDERYENLVSYAHNNNLNYKDYRTQIEYFFNDDLNDQEYFFKLNYNISIDDFKKLKDINKATEIFCKSFERPDDKYALLNQRVQYANHWYNRFVNGSMLEISN